MGRSVNARTNANTYLDHAESREPDPSEVAAARESDLVPRVLAWGRGAWPLPGQSRAPLMPDAPRDPGQTACAACHGRVRRHRYCLCCDRPKGSLVGRANASLMRRVRAKAEKLKGGKGAA